MLPSIQRTKIGHGEKDQGYIIADFVLKRGVYVALFLFIALGISTSWAVYAAQVRETEHVRESLDQMLALLQQHFDRERQTHTSMGIARIQIAMAVANHSSALLEIIDGLNDDPLNIYQV